MPKISTNGIRSPHELSELAEEIFLNRSDTSKHQSHLSEDSLQLPHCLGSRVPLSISSGVAHDDLVFEGHNLNSDHPIQIKCKRQIF